MEKFPSISKANAPEKSAELSTDQRRILDALQTLERSEESLEFQLSIEEIKNTKFLKAIAELHLPYEISFVEENGHGVVATGILDTQGAAAAGGERIIERHKKGSFSIHTHVSQEFVDLSPSPGDIEILGMEAIYNGRRTPSVIMNGAGILVFGFDPDYKTKEEAENDSGKYSWQLKNRCVFKFRDLIRETQFENKKVEDALQEFIDFLHKEGVLKLHKRWSEVTEDDLEFLNPKQA